MCVPPAASDARRTRLIAGNIRSAGAAEFVTRLAGFGLIVLLARELGEVELGRYLVALSLVALLAGMAELGTGALLVREGAQRPHLLENLLGRVLTLRIASSAGVVCLALVAAIALRHDSTTLAAVAILALAAAVRIVGATFLVALQVLERLSDASRVQAQHALVTSVAAACVVVLGGGVIEVAIAILVTASLLPPWAWRRLRKHWNGSIGLKAGAFRLAPAAVALSVSAVASTAILYLDAVLVHAFLGNAATGLYGAAYRPLIALYSLPAVYVTAIARSIAELALSSREELSRFHARALLHTTAVAVPIAVAGVGLSDDVLSLLYGSAYAEGEHVLSLLLASLVFTFPGWIAVTTAYALGHERVVAFYVVLALVGNAVGNVGAIPLWGIEGAAIVNLLTEALFLAAVLRLLASHGVDSNLRASFGKPLLAGGAALVAAAALAGVSLFLALVGGGIVYIMLLFVLNTFAREDAEFLRALISGSRNAPGEAS